MYIKINYSKGKCILMYACNLQLHDIFSTGQHFPSSLSFWGFVIVGCCLIYMHVHAIPLCEVFTRALH